MKTVRQILESDNHREAHLALPIGTSPQEIEVTVAWRPAPTKASSGKPKPPALEDQAGALSDDPLVRPEQPMLVAGA